MERKINILLFYKFQKIGNPKSFAKEHLKFCKKLEVLGKVLVSEEGINGSISGTVEQTEKYKKFLKSKKGFEDIWFKEEMSNEHPFTRMFVRVKKEIIALDKPINLNKIGKHLSPKEFLELYKKNEDVIILDARNDYESKVGKFKNAITPQIKTFREFPKAVEEMKNMKNKKIVMYCTGGIRCEKASAYMIQKGFKNVMQLKGGIINFCQQYPDTVWEGRCFVFDKRLMTNINQTSPPISECELCGKLCDLYRNCKNHNCDKLVIMCLNCEKKMNACCSKKCLQEFREHCMGKSSMKQNRRMETPQDIIIN
ncbi:MAG: rhodanese-related sulfurtransferase [Nanoarchaeota archaeon]